MRATIPVKAGVSAGTLEALRDLVQDERARRAEIIGVPTAGRGHRERAAQRAAQRAHMESLRQAGGLLDSIDVCVCAAVRRELDRRGWNGDFPKPPPEVLLPERPLGARTRSYPEELQARLPAPLVERVQAACWHHSRDAIEQIRQLYDRYSRQVVHRTPDLLRRYDELADRITTTGDLYRSAVSHLLEVRAGRSRPGDAVR